MADSNDRGGKRPGRPGGRPPRGQSFPDGPRRGGSGGDGRGKPPGRFGAERAGRREDGPRTRPFERRENRRSEEKPADAPAPARQPEAAPPAEERIAKVIARAGVASRRDAEAMIAEGRVTLNGETLTSPAVNVGPGDRIAVDGEPLPSRERTRLWLFHKPRGLVTTARDPQGRPTVFDSLPEDMPRVVAIGRLDINTEGLLLLTNDGGLAKVIAHPDTGWTRRYRARAHGEVTQADLDRLKNGITLEGMEYGPIEATLDRVQGDNVWITLALKEGKNREVKRVLEHLGLQVNRLIRLSFGPFQLGDLEPGLVEEVRTRVLKDQLGQKLAEEAGVDFESPVREPIPPFGKPEKQPAEAQRGKPERPPRPRTARVDDERARGRRFDDRERGPVRGERAPAARTRPKPSTVWHADAGENEEMPRRPHPRREDPKAERQAAAARERERIGAISSPEGRRVVVERLVADPAAEEKPRRPRREERAERPPRPDRPPRTRREDDDRPARTKRPAGGGFGRDRDQRPAERAGGRPAFGKPGGRTGAGQGRGGPSRGGPRPGGKAGPRPSGGAPRGRGR
ncbi:pseudouridine synthase [Enterovirga aerilata]|uniref:Pseudouridine synthase n=1 Tax=Enterovirga aerilata TaxID=2730920 RepID=A0A849I175_9HYPH|nr:pseudouridine synthase [Enterovirga sp. DB1703]NNM71314.1 rRNA pseudouridine synthase [Enterovirga sp. DB1703]